LPKFIDLILPIYAYGEPVLRKRGSDIEENSEELQKLIDDMFETMYHASGVGLAAPQIGKSLRLFIIDTSGFVENEEEDEEGLGGFKQVFINPVKLEEHGDPWAFNEGCLSIPEIREDVNRNERLELEYLDRDFKLQRQVFTGLKARVIQHEYDHIEGVLFTDHLSPLKKRLLKGKLSNISKGKIRVDYRMKFPKL
jgi:peptide deformylase